MIDIDDLLKKIKPTILGWISGAGGGTGPYAPTPHVMNSAHHSGEISDAQHGTRAQSNAHAHSHLSGIGANDHHAQAHAISGVDHTGTLSESQLPSTAIVESDLSSSTPQTVILTGSAGTSIAPSRADHVHALWQAIAPTWTGLHTFQNTLTTRDLVPETSELYDIGTPTKRYRTARVGELAATLFSKEEIMIMGNKLIIALDADKLPAAMNNSQTTYNFGRSMTVGDWIQINAEESTGGLPATEWILIGSLVSGTTYNVTRNVDGSGANSWAEGTPYVIIGQNGTYRIELTAGDPPSVKLVKQGATWNTQSTPLVIDDVGVKLIGDDQANDDAMLKFLLSDSTEIGRMGISYTAGQNLKINPATGTTLFLGTTGYGNAQRGLRISGTNGDVTISTQQSGEYIGSSLYIDTNRIYANTAGSYRSWNLLLHDPNIADLVLPANLYGPSAALISAPHCRAAWKMDNGYIGNSSTQQVPDLSGQERHLTIGGTVSFSQSSASVIGTFPQVPYASIAAGTNYLERTDETGLNITGYMTALGWFYFSDANAGANQYLFGKSDSNPVSSAWQWGLWVSSGFPTNQRRVVLSAPSGTTIKEVVGDYYLNSTWFFFACRFTSSTELALFEGKQTTDTLNKKTYTTSIQTSLNTTSQPFRVFRSGDGGMQMQGGRTSHLGLYAAALSDDTIQGIYQSQRDYFGG